MDQHRSWLSALIVVALLAGVLQSAEAMHASQELQEVRYDDYRVYKVRVKDAEQYQVLTDLIAEHTELNIWHEIREYGDHCDILAPPSLQSIFENQLKVFKFDYDIKIQNLQQLIEAQKPKVRTGAMEWTQYHTLDEMYVWLDRIIALYPNVVTPFTIGHSYEGREIRGIKISYKPGNKVVFVQGTIHAREWITSAVITYVIDELLVSRKPAVRDIAENIDWYFIPVINVDGFVYSHQVNRLWRKSRLPSDPTGKCIGTDLNRNYNFLWRSAGASDLPCDETYAGPFAESDPEIRQVVEFINGNVHDIRILLDMHSYGQYVLSPWGHTDEEFPENYDQMMACAKGYADAVYAVNGTTFTYGSSSTTLYKVSGSAKEWGYGAKGIPITYTIELPDKGQYGFILPPERIIPVAQEVVKGYLGLISAARAEKVL